MSRENLTAIILGTVIPFSIISFITIVLLCIFCKRKSNYTLYNLLKHLLNFFKSK